MFLPVFTLINSVYNCLRRWLLMYLFICYPKSYWLLIVIDKGNAEVAIHVTSQSESACICGRNSHHSVTYTMSIILAFAPCCCEGWDFFSHFEQTNSYWHPVFLYTTRFTLFFELLLTPSSFLFFFNFFFVIHLRLYLFSLGYRCLEF